MANRRIVPVEPAIRCECTAGVNAEVSNADKVSFHVKEKSGGLRKKPAGAQPTHLTKINTPCLQRCSFF